MRRGRHTDLGIPAANLRGPAASVLADLPGAKVVLFGFGDRHYVLSGSKNAGDLLAALWPGPGLMLVTGLVVTPVAAFGTPQVVTVGVDESTEAAIVDFVGKSLVRDAAGRAVRYARGPYEGSVYYAATARYALWHTCNTWTADALRAGGLPFDGEPVLFAGQVMRGSRQYADPAAGSTAEQGQRQCWIGEGL